MKIYVIGSTTFMKEMVEAKNQLRALGYDGWIHPDYEAFVRGEKAEVLARAASGEHAAVKRENNYLKVHYQHILQSDAVLVVNLEKNGVENYIGGNVLIEIGQAYVNDKIIFLLNDIPKDLPYTAEIESMDPISLHGDLNNIKHYEKNTPLENLPVKTNFTVLSSYRNKDKVNDLVAAIRHRGYTCYNFSDMPADPNNADAHPEEQMKVFEAKKDFHTDEHFQKLFKRDLAGLNNAEKVILLQPCGLSAHMEAGIAFGLGKPLIMIGEPIKPETLYLMFEERYSNAKDFLATLGEKSKREQMSVQSKVLQRN